MDQNHHVGCCGSRDTALSKFDYRRFLPMSERKKQLTIKSTEELWHYHNALLKLMLKCGDDVSGFIDHTEFISEMASSGVYDIRAIVAYDEAFLEKAREFGPGAFHGANTHLANTKLGLAGTKLVMGAQGGATSTGKNSHNYSGNTKNFQGGNRNAPSGKPYFGKSEGPKNLIGWRKTAADRGICFRFSQNMVCEGCQFKHMCVHCEATKHSMFDCKKGGDNKA